MCGIIAVLRRPSSRRPPAEVDLVGPLEAAVERLAGAGPEPAAADVARAADAVDAVDRLLRGVPGVLALVRTAGLASRVQAPVARLDAWAASVERRLDRLLTAADADHVEALNAALLRLKDACWAVGRDRLRTARAAADLAGADAGDAALAAFTSVQVALSALDRLEVRGRDSAGLHLLVTGHGLDLAHPDVRAALAGRAEDRLFRSRAVRTPDGQLAFVYKAAAEIGELGDNARALRAAIADDDLLRRALAAPSAEAVVLGHTRWASVGIISEPNAHPLTSEEDGRDAPYVVGVLNGDVDNYADLRQAEELRVPPEITTDAKVIPALVGRRLAEGHDLEEAFRRSVAELEGSVAVAVHASSAPGSLLLAQRGSGQALYVGLAEDAFVVASEPYGLVEETSTYVRLDGERGGQLAVLTRDGAGTAGAIVRQAYDGSEQPVGEGDLRRAEITTRDVDRGDAPHFLLKEITQAPASFRKTLRGKLAEVDGHLTVALGTEALPEALRARLKRGEIGRVLVIGQGTAAVAGQALAAALSAALGGRGPQVAALPATELSGFHLDDDMGDALVVAISQSGTTTDTNRTVDLVRARGGTVIAIVNRRNSDLTDKADGVLYTSDGRDVEMSVASTKAFYAQVAAGFLLARALADLTVQGDGRQQGGAPDPARGAVLGALRDLPAAMEQILARREDIAAAARAHAPPRRSWAVVGNGRNRIAASEVRIKLSELCYKSIACDATEDKKHIDLSSEPLILVCAAGLVGSTADDVAKEVEIYRAHKAAPVVIADEGVGRFPAAAAVITVPAVHADVAFVLAAMVGHLFGYEAALAIDAQARPLREARGVIESAVAAGPVALLDLDPVARLLRPPARRFFDGLRAREYDGHLEASTAARLASLFRFATGVVPLDAYSLEFGKVGSPGVALDDLTDALTEGIEQLTRPIDAIKHQAKTVTVGISRADETLLRVPLVKAVLDAGAARDRLTYRALRTLAELDPAVAEVRGWTRYAIEGAVDDGATISVVDRGGVARDIPSRTEANPTLRGTKHRIAAERLVTVERGRADGRTLVLVPEVKEDQASGLTLLHVSFHDRLPGPVARAVLQGYRNRYAALRDAVTETEPTFHEDLLAELPVVDLLTQPVHTLADRWRGR